MFRCRQRYWSFCALLALVSTTANGRSPGFNEVERCRVDTDPFAIPAYVPGLLPNEGKMGPLSRRFLKPGDAGQCVMQSEYRPVMTLEESEIDGFPFDRDDSRVYVANVRGFSGWYAASIPLLASQEAYFMVTIRYMPVLGVRGGHAQLRIKFNDDVILIPHNYSSADEIIRTRELVFTANPTGFDGPSRYDPIKNFDGSLLHALGIQTVESRLYLSFIKSHSDTEKQYRLNLSPLELAAYIKKYIELADKTRLTQRFILATRNCDATQFEILDSVLTHRYRLMQKPFDPQFAMQRLLERKLIDANSEIAPFESEPWAQEMFKTYGRMPAGGH